MKKAAHHGAIRPALWKKLVAEFEEINSKAIEPTLPLPVTTGEREIVTMSWGFRRSFKRKDGKGKTAARPVVTAKSEKMGDFMWGDAYQHRRCIVPCTEFCGFNFEERWGDLGKDFIHVHHLTEISSIGVEYEVDPINDLIPVCPNCHAMLHRRRPGLSLEELIAQVTK